MPNNSRTQNTLRNLKIGMIMQILGYILSFVNRTVFIYVIGTTYLGVNSLFTNILTLLSFTEAGAESAFSSLLYKPLRDGDEETVNSIMKAFKRVFFIIGCIVAAVGLALTPALDFFISEDASKIEHIHLIYLMFLGGSVVNYVFTYKISLIKADQKTYIVSINDELIAIAQYVLQIVAVLLFNSFLWYVGVQMALSVLRNLLLSARASKMYPYLKKPAKPFPRELKEKVAQRIRGGVFLHTGFIINNGTDNIVITKFLGIDVTGIYSNYLMVTSIIGCLLNIVYNSIYASVGDLIAEGDREKTYRYFKYIIFGSFSLLSAASVGMMVMFNPFINLWVGEGYTFSAGTVILIVAVFLMGSFGIKRPLALFKNSCGLFYNDRYFALAEGITNLVLSLVLVQFIGFNGVMIGTIVASCITLLSGVYVLHKNLFKKSALDFFIKLGVFGVVTAGCTALLMWLYSFIGCANWLVFLLEGAGCVILVAVAVCVVFCKTEEFRFAWNFVSSAVGRRVKFIKTK